MAAPGRLNLVETLLALEDAGRTGVVRFERGKDKKQLVLQGGKLAAAESNVPGEHLAMVLVQQKRLDKKDLTAVAALMKSGKTTDEAVLASGKVDAAVLTEAAREQALMIVASLFAWSECESRFYTGDSLVRRGVNLQMSLAELVVLAARRAVSKRPLPPSLPKLDGLTVARGESARLDPRKLPLDGQEAILFGSISEPLPASRLLAAIPPPTPGEEILLRLLLLGLVRVETPKTAEPDQDDVLRTIEEMLHRFEVGTHYEVLGIPVDAMQDAVQSSYHELAKEYHPDRFQSREHSLQLRSAAEKLFTYITAAYTTLADPTSRAMYDEARLKAGQVEAAVRARAGAEVDKEKMAETLFSAGRARLMERDYDKAASHLKECVYLQPDVARYRHYLGLAQMQVPRLRKEAEEHLQKAIELNRGAVESILALGKLYILVNLPRRAEMQFQEALRWDPHNETAQRLLDSIGKEQSGGGILGRVKRPFGR